MIALSIWAADYAGTKPANERRVAPPAAASTDPAATPSAPPTPPPAPQPQVEPDAPTPAEPTELTDEGLADDERSRTHRGLTVAQARQRVELIAASRKRESDNLARHQTNTDAWAREARSATWAKPVEDDITQLLIDSGIDHMLIDIKCRETMCMLEVDISGSHSALGALHETPGLVEAFGDKQMSTGFKDNVDHQQRTFVLLGPSPKRR